jgi:lipopolysaccharide transport protein LptA
MAASRLNNLFMATLLGAAACQAAGADPIPQNVSVKAQSYEMDLRSGKTIMRDVTISQDDVSITADSATGTGQKFDDSRWEFAGNVRIQAEQRGSMHSDHAVVEFRNNRIARATIKGSPAEFEQKSRGSAETARGRAGEIIYEVGAGTVRFANDAWLSNGQNEISGPLLVYNIRLEKVQASTQAGGDQRVQITIVPKAGAEGEREPRLPPAPPPAPEPPKDPGQTAR